MNYEQCIDYIKGLEKFGSQLGLERIKQLLALLDNPQDKLQFIHIAGTNGKGSTVAMCSNALIAANKKVGCFISPYVFNFNERFSINGRNIDDDEFARVATKVITMVDKMTVQITEFELITAIGFLYYFENNCDIVCLEVGLGGRFDATNVITPKLCIIASISLDHTEILGDTVAQIAFEKAGIIKKAPIVSYPLQDNDAIEVILKQCAVTGSTLILPNYSAITDKKITAYGSSFKYANIDYTIKLVGEHQIYNAVTVIEAMTYLGIDTENIVKGLSVASMPARFETVSHKPLIILDGAHNLQAAIGLSNNIKLVDKPKKIAIIGMLKDKDYKAAVAYITSLCMQVITVPVNNPRGLPPDILRQCILPYCNNVQTANSCKEALSMIQADDDTAVFICGSFYMVGQDLGFLN